MTHGRLLVLAVAVALGLTASFESTVTSYQGTATAVSPATPAELSAADLAVLTAARGFTAGFVLSLPSHLNRHLADPLQARVITGELPSVFDIWLHDATFDVMTLKQSAVNRRNSAEELLSSFVVANPSHGLTLTRSGTGVEILKAQAAGICRASLKRSVRADVRGRDILSVVFRIVYEATGARVPGGFAGTCLGASAEAHRSADIQKGQSLEDALSGAVAQFGTAVWVAVQSEAGECSLGLLQQAIAGEKVCVMSVARNIAGN